MARFRVGDLVVKKLQPVSRPWHGMQHYETSTSAHGVILSEIMPSSDSNNGIDALRVRFYSVWFDGAAETVTELDIEPFDES